MLPAEPLRVEEALCLFGRHVSNAEKISARLKELTDYGHLETAQINLAGIPSAVFWFRVEHDKLVIDTLQALSAGRTAEQSYEAFYGAISQVASNRGCEFIEGVTARKALAEVYQSNGFVPVGVLMRKKL